MLNGKPLICVTSDDNFLSAGPDAPRMRVVSLPVVGGERPGDEDRGGDERDEQKHDDEALHERHGGLAP